MANSKDKSWEDTLREINNHLGLERNIIKNKLESKIEEFKLFKEEVYKEKNSSNTINKAREDRIRKLELALDGERKECKSLKTKNESLAEELRNLSMKLSVLEKENYDLRLGIQKRVSEINNLRMELLPKYGLSKKAHNLGQLDKLENSLKDTEDFYRSISGKIDKILRG